MTATRSDILARLDPDQDDNAYDWHLILDQMDEAGLVVDIPDPIADDTVTFTGPNKAAEAKVWLEAPDRWFGEWQDRPAGYDQWRISGAGQWIDGRWPKEQPGTDRMIVEARPVPQPARWVQEDPWHFTNGNEHLYIAQATTVHAADLLAALNAAADQETGQ